MKRELGFGRCGLACCLCSENTDCTGCQTGTCGYAPVCENRRCSQEKDIPGCYTCSDLCRKGLLDKIKPYGFSLFIQRYGMEMLLDCLERNEQNGLVYHRQGVEGDYDGFSDVEVLIAFIQTGKRQET